MKTIRLPSRVSVPPDRGLSPQATSQLRQPNVNRAVGERVNYPTTGALQQTLGAAINAVVNRPGWSSGNAIAVVNNSDQDPGAVVSFGRTEYRAFEYGSPATNGPKLHIVYTPPPVSYSVGTDHQRPEDRVAPDLHLRQHRDSGRGPDGRRRCRRRDRLRPARLHLVRHQPDPVHGPEGQRQRPGRRRAPSP